MTYVIWSMETRNLVASYVPEEEALEFLRESARVHGDSYVEGLALVSEDRQGRSRTIATGAALMARTASASAEQVA